MRAKVLNIFSASRGCPESRNEYGYKHSDALVVLVVMYHLINKGLFILEEKGKPILSKNGCYSAVTIMLNLHGLFFSTVDSDFC